MQSCNSSISLNLFEYLLSRIVRYDVAHYDRRNLQLERMTEQTVTEFRHSEFNDAHCTFLHNTQLTNFEDALLIYVHTIYVSIVQ